MNAPNTIPKATLDQALRLLLGDLANEDFHELHISPAGIITTHWEPGMDHVRQWAIVDECPSCRQPNGRGHTDYCQLRTPDAWSAELGVRVMDPDGWRGTKGRPYTDRITRAEFEQRAAFSTVIAREYPGQPAPSRPAEDPHHKPRPYDGKPRHPNRGPTCHLDGCAHIYESDCTAACHHTHPHQQRPDQ